MRNLAIIPARSGSKGLPDKNIKELCGKPLMAYSIEVALNSQMFDRVHVSTDSLMYAEIAKHYGADIRFLRSEKNSSDTSSTWEVILEVLEKYALLGEHFDTISVLQPTVPLRTAEDIRAAYCLMETKNAEAVVSVCTCEHSPMLCNTIGDDLSMDGFIDPSKGRRQDYKEYYRLNGAIYLVKTDNLKEKKIIEYNKKCFALVMPVERSVDIDNRFDFNIAQAIMQMHD